MREYRFSRARTDYVTALTAAHDELQAFWETKHPRRMVRDFLMRHQTEPERFFTDLMELKRADLAAQDPAHPTWEARAQALDELERILREWIWKGLPRRVADLAVNGRDLMAAGFTGPRIAEEKTRLLRLVMDDPGLNTREALLRRLSGRTGAAEE